MLKPVAARNTLASLSQHSATALFVARPAHLARPLSVAPRATYTTASIRLQRSSLLGNAPLKRTFATSSPSMSDNVKAISSYDEFKQIINEDKVAAIDFWATWCGPCKMISPMFEKFANEAPADKIAFYKVDVDDQEQIAAECGISAMPTFVFFKKGEKVHQVVGAVPQQLQAGIKQFS